jgi:hypothetical protein
MLSGSFPINTFLKQQEQSRELKAWRKSSRSQQYIMGFIAELPIAIVIPKFLIIMYLYRKIFIVASNKLKINQIRAKYTSQIQHVYFRKKYQVSTGNGDDLISFLHLLDTIYAYRTSKVF